MAQSTTVSLKYNTRYHNDDPLANSNPGVTSASVIGNGTLAAQADTVLDLFGSVAASSTATIDISTAVDAFGRTPNLQKLKAIVFANTSGSTRSSDLKIQGGASNGFVAPWGTLAGGAVAYVSSVPVIVMNPTLAGWTVDSSHKTLKISNLSGSDAGTYTLRLIGVKA